MLERASNVGSTNRLVDALNYFECNKDKDIETFLHKKAVEFIRRGWCSVYLILDEEAFDNGKIKVLAYFTLSNKVLDLSVGNASNSKVRAVGGIKNVEYLHFILIGQLGKFYNDECCAEISSEEILDYAFEIIYNVNYLIPCRCVLVECSDEEKIHAVYKNYGFVYFQYDGEHHQFYKRI